MASVCVASFKYSRVSKHIGIRRYADNSDWNPKQITKRCLNAGIRIRRIPNKCILSPDVEYLILIHVHESLMVVVVEKSHLRITNSLFKRKLLTLRSPPSIFSHISGSNKAEHIGCCKGHFNYVITSVTIYVYSHM